jgi:hypothetical protein
MKNTFIPLAYNFWNIVHLLVEQMENSGNKTMIFSDYKEGQAGEEIERQINETFKKNDYNIGVPIMFNFYHGLELFMKGLLEIENITLDRTYHNLQDLYKQIKANESKYTPSLIQLLKSHIYNAKSFNQFFESNNIKVNDFYIGLKYPQDKNGEKQFKYFKIRGKEGETLKIYKAMSKATLDFRDEVVMWLKSKRQ